MVAKNCFTPTQNEKGQSLLEVVIVLPFLFLFVAMLFKMNLALQTSINHTQFSHSQLYVLTANSPEYPALRFTQYGSRAFAKQGQDMMITGVSDPSALVSSADETALDPIPQTQTVTRNKSITGSQATGEVSKRAEVRIRNTVAICTQLNVIPTGSSDRWPFKGPVCNYKGMDGT